MHVNGAANRSAFYRSIKVNIRMMCSVPIFVYHSIEANAPRIQGVVLTGHNTWADNMPDIHLPRLPMSNHPDQGHDVLPGRETMYEGG